ncbi:UNVERIFIED_CONTAM: hypothetical protein FKN15_043480 [Acipenser sinensis]
MTTRRTDKINIQEHMAINVCPGPIRAIKQISDYFPRFHDYPAAIAARKPDSPKPAPALPSNGPASSEREGEGRGEEREEEEEEEEEEERKTDVSQPASEAEQDGYDSDDASEYRIFVIENGSGRPPPLPCPCLLGDRTALCVLGTNRSVSQVGRGY